MSAVAKAAVRISARRRRNGLTRATRATASALIAARVLDLDAWPEARTVAAYMPIETEVDTRFLIADANEEGKRVVVPRVTEDGLMWHVVTADEVLAPGSLGVPEPAEGTPTVALEAIDLMVVPGLAFDSNGHRIGYGGGYYDRVLEAFEGVAVGIAYEAQLVPGLPIAKHDRAVHFVVTEKQILDTRP